MSELHAEPLTGAVPGVATTEGDERRPRLRLLSALWTQSIVIGITVLLLLVAGSFLGKPSAPTLTEAASWFPVDGHRERFSAQGSETLMSTEWSRPTNLSLLHSELLDYEAWFYGADEDLTTADFARARSVLTDSDGEYVVRQDTVWTFGEDGARAGLDSTVGAEELVFVPGRLDVPDDLADDSTWTSEGTAFRWDPVESEYVDKEYRATYRATVSSQGGVKHDGCLDIEMRLNLGGDLSTSIRTWCRGEGIVAFSDLAGEWAPSDELPIVKLTDAPFDWGSADGLQYSVAGANQRDVEGSVPLTPWPNSPPGVMDGGAIFANRARPDVLALDTTVDPATIVWGARPGGYATVSATLGSVTVVATAELTAVAYGIDGQWLWEVPLSDIAVVPPVRFGEDLAVLATLDGELTAVDLASGATVWSTNLGSSIRVAPTATDDALVVAANDGSLTRFDRDGEQIWSAEIARPGSVTVWEGPSAIVITGDSEEGIIHGYRLTDGAELWSRNVRSIAHELISMDDVVGLRGDYRVLGINPADGAVMWDWSEQPTWVGIGGGDRLLLMSESELILLDEAGDLIRSWEHELGRVTGATASLAADSETVIAFGPFGIGVGVVR